MRLPMLALTFVAAITLGLWIVASWAQVIDGTPCSDACYKQKAACVSECGGHRNPMECDGECNDALEDCLRECRD